MKESSAERPGDAARGQEDLLHRQALRAERLRQEVLALRHQLETESHRFEIMQRFVRAGMLCDTREELSKLICESMMEVLVCGAGILWCLRCEQKPGCEISAGIPAGYYQWDDIKQWIDQWVVPCPAGGFRKSGTVPPPPPASLGFQGAVLSEVLADANGEPLSVLIAANLAGRDDAHQDLGPAAASAFKAFSQQAGVLIQSLEQRRMISEQIETIRTSERRLSNALAGSQVGLWEIDIATGRTYYSEEWKQQIGHTGDEVGDSLDEFFSRLHPDDLGRLRRLLRNEMERDVPYYKATFRFRHKNGSWRWITSVGFKVADADKPEPGAGRLVGTHIDVSDFKKLEGRLLKARETEHLARLQAERENRAKSSFLASVSHEIRTPLNGIMAAFQMLRLKPTDSERLHLIDVGERSSRWMLKIIGESLDISRIESGRLELNPEPVVLSELLGELRGLQEQRALEKEIGFRWSINPGLPACIRIDPTRLRQVLSNLIDNAIKFTFQGEVSFSATVAGIDREGRWRLRFVVEDTGVGFSKEFKRLLFTPFVQASAKRDVVEHGIGLGLAITRELVRLMNGRIFAHSKPGAGSRFVVVFPVEPAEPAATGKGGAAEGDRGALAQFRGRALLAEDDPISAEMGKLMIQRLGFEVSIARNGREALEKASQTAYDLIFMDCWMPEMGGIEATRELRSNPAAASRTTPVIALTANARRSDEEACVQVGMNGFLTKPLMFDALIRLIERCGLRRAG